MKKYGFMLLAWALIAGSCKQDDDQAAAAPITLDQYIDANKISATADSRGFYYTIQAPGSGAKPTASSNVTVNYIGKLTNGNTFDSGKEVSFNLRDLIVGWQYGIPLIAPGGSITLYLPPSLAYGSRAVGDIPANSVLIFTIDLVRVN